MGSVVEINPLTRVEGHGSLKVYLDGTRVERVELSLSESPRLFEALLLGRGFSEVPEIVCRICSLCSTVHKVTALLAVEKALGVEVSRVTRLTRELMLNGGLIQSHALHLYCLLLPDRFGLPGVADLAREAPELLKTGLAIKRVGNLIQETAGGRLIHPVNLVLGGVGRRVPRDYLLNLRDELEAVLPACAESVDLFRSPPKLPPLPPPSYLALAEEDLPFCGERLVLHGVGEFPAERYRDQVIEAVPPHSHAKNASVGGKRPCVGALARLNVGTPLGGGPLSDGVIQEVLGRDIGANVLAQAIELDRAGLRSRELLDQLLDLGEEGGGNVPALPGAGHGTAVCEAPRGVLIHSYRFDGSGTCIGADVVTPTSLNQAAIEEDLLAAARALEGTEAGELARTLELLVRCYDPCISCAVHLIRL